jgi:hypothetical protein
VRRLLGYVVTLFIMVAVALDEIEDWRRRRRYSRG